MLPVVVDGRAENVYTFLGRVSDDIEILNLFFTERGDTQSGNCLSVANSAIFSNAVQFLCVFCCSI